jgi:hypothetical protein
MRENYTNYSKSGFTPVESKEIPEAAPEQIEVTNLESVEPEITPEELDEIAAQVEEAIAAEEVAPPAEPKTGIVTANKLNIRKLPSPTAPVVAVVDKDTELMIEPGYETVEWIQVYTPAGVDGYCMKKFVTIK